MEFVQVLQNTPTQILYFGESEHCLFLEHFGLTFLFGFLLNEIKTNMKTLITIFVSICLIGGCAHTCTIKEVKVLQQENDSLKTQIKGLKEHIEFLSNELELRESEISYWGHKYDSCRVSK